MIAILDYGLGNIKSIYNMLKKIGVVSKITSNVNEIKNAEKYILPGVGSFDHGITKLRSSPFFDILVTIFSILPTNKAWEPSAKSSISDESVYLI